MRYLFVLILSLVVAGSVYADTEAAPTTQPQTIEEKLEKTRALMEHNKTTPSQTAPAQQEEASSPLMKMVQSLGLLVGLVLVGAWGYKKLVLKDVPVVSRKMKLLERMSLAPRASLYLAEVEGNKILVGLTADGISMMKLGTTIELTEEYQDA